MKSSKRGLLILGCLGAHLVWAAATVSISGKVKSLSGGVVTIESSDLTTQIKMSQITQEEQELIRDELSKSGQVTVHVPAQAILEQKKVLKK